MLQLQCNAYGAEVVTRRNGMVADNEEFRALLRRAEAWMVTGEVEQRYLWYVLGMCISRKTMHFTCPLLTNGTCFPS